MAEEEQEESVEETGSAKKKLIIMVAGGVVLLAILVGAGLYFMGVFDDEKAPVTAESSSAEENLSEQDADAEEADADAAETADVVERLYQALTPPFMVNFPDGDIKVIKVAMSLMANDDKVISAVRKHDPVIRNNILMLLSSQDPEILKTAEGKAELQAAVKVEVNKVLAERKISSKVKEVFFTDLVMQ